MEDTIALIDRIMEEHKAITQNADNLEQLANDVEAAAKLEKAKEAFVPGRFNQQQGLQQMQESLEIIRKGIEAHFEREEMALLAAFEKHGDRRLVSALRSLVNEHEGLRNRFVQMKQHVVELTGGELASQLWGARAHDMRVYASHTLKLLGAHARNEHELLLEMSEQLKKGSKEKIQ